MYGLINKVPENIKFFCTLCCSVFSTIFDTSACLDGALSLVKVKLDDMEGKLCKCLEDVQT